MVFTVIDNDALSTPVRVSGFRNAEFKRLAALYSRACSARLISDMAVDVDMDAGLCCFSYFRAAAALPSLVFVVRHAGPRANLYELWAHERGRVAKSGLFDRVYRILEGEIENLKPV